jgi:hypothetical protein
MAAKLGARRHAREEEGSEPGRERRRGKWRGVQEGLQGVLLVLEAASMTWSTVSSSPATQVLEVEDTGGFAKSSLALEDFSGRFKNSTHLQYFVKQTNSRIYGNYPGASLLIS